jgi:phospholipase C
MAAKHDAQAPIDLVMGYYDETDLPVYDLLASQFCVCDRWFSSVPGAT